MKNWYHKEFQQNQHWFSGKGDSAQELCVDFANRHKLSPGELVVLTFPSYLSSDTLKVMYYAEKELL